MRDMKKTVLLSLLFVLSVTCDNGVRFRQVYVQSRDHQRHNKSSISRSFTLDDVSFNGHLLPNQLMAAFDETALMGDPLVSPMDPFLEPATPVVDKYPAVKHGQEGFVPVPRRIGSRLKDSFYSSSIINDLRISAPSSLLKVQFPNLATVCLGNQLSFIDTMLEPSLNWPGSSTLRPSVTVGGKKKVLHPLYTIIMVDPDVPMFAGQFVHMLKVNVPGAGSRGHTVIPYTPPLPVLPAKNKPPSPFVHRYILLIFAQNKVIQPDHARDYLLGESLAFRVSKFIRGFMLDPIPIAGNFFYGSLYARSKVVC